MMRPAHALVAALLLLLPSAAPAGRLPLQIELDLKSGATISDVTPVVAHVTGQGNADIEKVEFEVDGQLKYTATAVPYTFNWDTLADSEGSHNLTVTVTDSKDRKAQAKATVTIDNELSKGVEYYANGALEAVKAGNTDQAAKLARRALKIAPDDYRAARALAAVDRQKGDIAGAIQVLEQAKLPADDVQVRRDLSALYIEQGAQADTSDDFVKAAGKAIDTYKSALANRVAAAGSNPVGHGDALAAAGNWDGAIAQYEQCGEANDARMECVNRLLLADINTGRTRETRSLLGSLIREKRADQVTHALEAYQLLRDHQPTRAREMVQEGVDAGVLPALIVAAYADLELRQGKKAREEEEKAFAIAPDVPAVLLLRSYVQPDPIDSDKTLIRVLELDPLNADAYAARGYRTLLSRGMGRYQAADQLFALAMKRSPNDPYAVEGAALSLIGQQRPKEAEPLLDQLATLDPNAADVHGVRAFNYSLGEKSFKTNDELEAARKLDPEDWADVLLPKPPELTAHVFRYKYPVWLTPDSLYPATAPAAAATASVQ